MYTFHGYSRSSGINDYLDKSNPFKKGKKH
jgi:hypothetical protein